MYPLKEETNLWETAAVKSSKRVFLMEINVSKLVLAEAFCNSHLQDPTIDLCFVSTAEMLEQTCPQIVV